MAMLFMCARLEEGADTPDTLPDDADNPSCLEYTDLVGQSVISDLDLPDTTFQEHPVKDFQARLDTITKDESLLEDITYAIVADIKRLLGKHRDTTHLLILKI